MGLFTTHLSMGKIFDLRYFAKDLNTNLNPMEYIYLSTVCAMEYY